MNQTEKKKKAILETTFQLLNEKKIKKITIDEIAQKATVSKVTLFKYFKNKNNLMNTVILQSFEETTQEIEAILQSQLDFEATYEAITTMEMAQFGRYKPIFSENLLTQYHESPDFFNRDAVSAQSRIYEQLFQKGQAEGKIAATYSKADFMFVLTLFINGLKGLSTNQLIQKSALISHFFITGWK